MNPENFKLC